MHKIIVILPAMMLAAGATAAQAQSAAEPSTPEVIRNLSTCLDIADDAQRLACYDAQARALVDASESGDLVAVDREEVRALQRESFGFSLSGVGKMVARLSPLDGGGDEGPSDEPAADEVTLTIQSAEEFARGRYRFTFDNGQVWEQTTSERIFLPNRVAGTPAEISSASFGSYLMRVRGQRSVPVRRLQ